MSRGMSRGGSGFPIIIAVLGVLILGVIGIFIYMQLSKDGNESLDLATTEPTSEATALPTAIPDTTATPETAVVTVEPTVEATATVEATSTPYITAPPTTTSDTVWINVDALKIHTAASFESDTVGKIPYGTQVSGDVSGKWMNTSYDGTSGYIYLGKTSDGRACVVYNESSLQALDPEPDADEIDLVTSITKASDDGNYYYIDVHFSTSVYSDDNGTGTIDSSCFTITGATYVSMSGGVEGTTYVQLKIQPLATATEAVVTVKSQQVFNSAGQAAKSESATFVY